MHKEHFVIACLVPTAGRWVILLRALFSAHQTQRVKCRVATQVNSFHVVVFSLTTGVFFFFFLLKSFGSPEQTLTSSEWAADDGHRPNVTPAACDPANWSLYILALCLRCIRGLCRPLPPRARSKLSLMHLNLSPYFANASSLGALLPPRSPRRSSQLPISPRAVPFDPKPLCFSSNTVREVS